MKRLQDRVAVVTGSSSGNGRAIALALAREGAKVVCADVTRRANPAGYEPDVDQDTDDLIRAGGSDTMFVEADVADSAAVKHLMSSAVDRFGRLDVLVNNAGIGYIKAITDETEEEYERTMAVNARGAWLCCKTGIEQMLQQEPRNGSRGRIVNISSVGGIVGLRNESSYCMSKGAVVLLTKSLAIDYAPERINVNAVCPGVIATSINRSYLEDPVMSRAIRAITPWPEIGETYDVAMATLFLASDDAKWATGVILPIDGGLTAP
jgi:NAD(P)-dependent dehydrogenase (short-subunit alcohol dehydrogenase family)